MNDKCAAGTGRFFEMAEKILDTPIHQFENLALCSDEPATINNTCVVFAESEMVSLLASGIKTPDIIAGMHQSNCPQNCRYVPKYGFGRGTFSGTGDLH